MSLDNVKDKLVEKFDALYIKFMQDVCAIPAASNLVGIAHMHFDTGYLWVEKAIRKMPVVDEKPVQTSEETHDEIVGVVA